MHKTYLFRSTVFLRWIKKFLWIEQLILENKVNNINIDKHINTWYYMHMHNQSRVVTISTIDLLTLQDPNFFKVLPILAYDKNFGIMGCLSRTSSSMRCSMECLSDLILLTWQLAFKGQFSKCLGYLLAYIQKYHPMISVAFSLVVCHVYKCECAILHYTVFWILYWKYFYSKLTLLYLTC